MLKRFILCFFAATFAVSAGAQSERELQQGRQRGWTQTQVNQWDAYLNEITRKNPLLRQDFDCPDFTSRRDVILNGNRITTQITNFGSISSPGNRITDIVWNGLGYGFEFGPFVAAEIVDENHDDPQSVPKRDEFGNVVRTVNGDTVWVMHVISDGLVSNGGERSPDDSEWWGWSPIPCAQPVGNFAGMPVVEPTSSKIPTNDAADTDLDGKPDSWPDAWFNDNLKQYVWPGALQQGASNADKEALYFMNDYNNQEFAYTPFPNNPNIAGLGLEVETRLYQWSNPLAEDAIFLVYKITNKSDQDLENVIFGMWGDPHIGGPGDWPDDLAFFDKDLNMVFAWDADGFSDIPGRVPGYFGYKFLESPGVDDDGIDNDGDGYVDESWTDGIDNDGDWDPEKDDVGQDGLPNTNDFGEGDGIPTAGDQFDITKPGEPNFEFTDINESDMIGLTSFASPPFAGNRISNDEKVWTDFIQPGKFDAVPVEPGDYVFIYGSGNFRLKAGETKRFSIALIVGENLEDLLLNAETVQQIYDAGYRFAKPPDKPIAAAVPGDQKVTLYWDNRAEASFDPISETNDFEGYAIYRSTDPLFSDQQTITDINGTKFLFQPLKNNVGVEAKFDLNNGISGVSSVPYRKRGVAYDLGDDTGLFHTYVDSNNVINGQTYYYAVVAYDHGAPALDLPPSETSKSITYDPSTDTFTFDVNTLAVVPRPKVAGYVAPTVGGEEGVVHTTGFGTGNIQLRIVDDRQIEDQNEFRIEFDESGSQTHYSVIDNTPVEIMLTASAGKATGLRFAHIVPSSFTLSAGGTTFTEGTDYTLSAEAGIVEILEGGGIPEGAELTARFTYAPVYQSTLLANEEANPIFDGLQIFVDDHPLELNETATGWASGGGAITFEVNGATAGPGREIQPADYEVRFANSPVTTSIATNLPLPFEVFNLTKANQQIDAFVADLNRNGEWDTEETIIFFENVDGNNITTWQVRFEDPTGSGAKPGSGDVFFLATRKPFADNDTFTFTTTAATTNPALVQEELRDIYVVPNPYVATNVIEPRNPISNTERGDRRLYFANVPSTCTIRIYTLSGELVDTIEHESTLDDGKAFWDLRTKDNMNIAYGLYLFHVESAEGTFIGKFAVIK